MTKRIMRVISIALVAVFALMILSQSALATSTVSSMNVGDMFQGTDNSGASTAVSNIIGAIINIAQIIGMGVAVIMLVVLAIQYISAAPEGKAEIKKNSTIYIVGAIILFSAAAILQIVKNFAEQNVGKTQ